jgi:2-desacetyl-2-hydroxyethyl bacteriochlorophyllide A dehydrogenase
MAERFVGRRVLVRTPGTVEIAEWAVDPPGPGEVVIQAERTLISPGTELARVYNTHRAPSPYPTNIGYLACGRIAAVGEGVEAWRVGQRVLASMGHISYLRAKADRPGMMAVPESVPPEKLVFANLAAISLRGVRLGCVVPGRGALVVGQGLIGLFATYFAKRFGAVPVLAADLCAQRLALAERLGADRVLVPPQEGFAQAVRDWLGAELPSVVIDATGTPHVIAACLKFAADNGRVIVLGGVHRDVTLDLYTDFQKRNLQLRGCGYPSPESGTGTADESTRMCLDLICRGELDVARLTTHVVAIEEAPRMYRLLREQPASALGVVFDWQQE